MSWQGPAGGGGPTAAMTPNVEELTELVSASTSKHERASAGDIYGLSMYAAAASSSWRQMPQEELESVFELVTELSSELALKSSRQPTSRRTSVSTAS